MEHIFFSFCVVSVGRELGHIFFYLFFFISDQRPPVRERDSE